MKERSIILNADEVRGALDGSVTQLRRPVSEKLWPLLDQIAAYNGKPTWQCLDFDVKCPWDVERFWVKETWRVGAWDDESHSIAVDYRADNFIRREWLPCDPPEMYARLRHQTVMDAIRANAPVDKDGIFSWSPGNSPCRWRPPTSMPRWASRLTLEITDIRVERVQDISDADAFAEGIQRAVDEGQRDDGSARGAFRTLWDSINAKRGFGWDSNPWVWAISFGRLK